MDIIGENLLPDGRSISIFSSSSLWRSFRSFVFSSVFLFIHCRCRRHHHHSCCHCPSSSSCSPKINNKIFSWPHCVRFESAIFSCLVKDACITIMDINNSSIFERHLYSLRPISMLAVSVASITLHFVFLHVERHRSAFLNNCPWITPESKLPRAIQIHWYDSFIYICFISLQNSRRNRVVISNSSKDPVDHHFINYSGCLCHHAVKAAAATFISVAEQRWKWWVFVWIFDFWFCELRQRARRSMKIQGHSEWEIQQTLWRI